ncbi:Arc family DNA-binding protein [Paraburkholderia sp. Tr-20389]|uniref:Arc family DNA-binding protein n=1 Tax=Paraburkholderia sp. Tr-20389 TaxID=2703903 RepID=UPI00197E84E1|nr:Arc family DNA-binding protein [Paraburkholderia sp. Tr-20389]MBN3757242.1 Arc family DNA-binding protein [Paraburkholderia sp. Tr-20389]
MAKQDDYTKTALRLPRELHQKLTDAASERGHSLNTEMVYRLGASFDGGEDSDRQIEINAILKGLRDTIAEVARNDNERDDAVRAMGRDLHLLCREAMPLIDDEHQLLNVLHMLAAVGAAMQAGDITDAQGQLRALYYLASKIAAIKPANE